MFSSILSCISVLWMPGVIDLNNYQRSRKNTNSRHTQIQSSLQHGFGCGVHHLARFNAFFPLHLHCHAGSSLPKCTDLCPLFPFLSRIHLRELLRPKSVWYQSILDLRIIHIGCLLGHCSSSACECTCMARWHVAYPLPWVSLFCELLWSSFEIRLCGLNWKDSASKMSQTSYSSGPE